MSCKKTFSGPSDTKKYIAIVFILINQCINAVKIILFFDLLGLLVKFMLKKCYFLLVLKILTSIETSSSKAFSYSGYLFCKFDTYGSKLWSPYMPFSRIPSKFRLGPLIIFICINIYHSVNKTKVQILCWKKKDFTEPVLWSRHTNPGF